MRCIALPGTSGPAPRRRWKASRRRRNNCGDHYAYIDRSIDQLHYLRYSDREWRRWNNAFLYQNRLRAEDFTRMARDAGFTIELDISRVTPERLAQLDATPVHAEFAGYTRDQLAITCIDFIGRNP